MTIKDAITQFVSFHQNLGEKYETRKTLLTAFSRHVGEDRKLKSLTTTDIEGFLYRKGTVTGIWFEHHTALKGLFEWAYCRDLIDTIPLPTTKPQRSSTFTPYIYSKEELRKLFDSALMLPDTSKRKAIPYVFKVLFTLIYATGMRAGEALSLTVGDVDMDESLIRINGTKFFKSRIVPFNSQIHSFLSQYIDWRNSEGYSFEKSSPFFMTRKGERIPHGMLQNKFEIMRALAGIGRHDSHRFQPRIHDLRHSFATHRLEQWYKEGADVSAMLPILSVYLGHTSVKHTSVYLSVTAELLRHASNLYENYTNKQQNES